MQNQFGGALREWRARRRVSQLDLSLSAGVSSRHIAFLETGRARPSRAMVMRLGEALNVPRAERNRMLDAAGFRPAWTERRQDSSEMAPVMDAMRRIMDRHDPYPAFALDRHWRAVSANQSGAFVLSAFGLETGGSLLDAMMESGRAQEMIENWPEVAAHMLTRLRTESAHFGGDPVLDRAAALLAADPAVAKLPVHHEMPPISPARYRLGGQIFSVFSTIAQFGSAEDIALADLRIELLFPADEQTRELFEAAGGL